MYTNIYIYIQIYICKYIYVSLGELFTCWLFTGRFFMQATREEYIYMCKFGYIQISKYIYLYIYIIYKYKIYTIYTSICLQIHICKYIYVYKFDCFRAFYSLRLVLLNLLPFYPHFKTCPTYIFSSIKIIMKWTPMVTYSKTREY